MTAKVNAHAAVCQPQHLSAFIYIKDQIRFPISEYSTCQGQGIIFICQIICSTAAFVTELIYV